MSILSPQEHTTPDNVWIIIDDPEAIDGSTLFIPLSAYSSYCYNEFPKIRRVGLRKGKLKKWQRNYEYKLGIL